jgi:UDP-2,3-diacylglucosamine hydrolase
MIELVGGDRALFASDMHLGEHDPATAEVFLARLRELAASASHVFLLGDLFEAWVGDDFADPVCERALDALRGLTQAGRRLFVMRGNRDFLLDAPLRSQTDGPMPPPASFSARTGAEMLADPTAVWLFGERALLAHGDALCTDDADYQRFRALTRDAGWQRGFLARPREERVAIAQDLRARSELSKSSKADSIMDVNAGTVETAMRAAGARLLIHGHTHRPARHALTIDGRPAWRLVLPDWDAARGRGGMLLATAQGISEA